MCIVEKELWKTCKKAVLAGQVLNVPFLSIKPIQIQVSILFSLIIKKIPNKQGGYLIQGVFMFHESLLVSRQCTTPLCVMSDLQTECSHQGVLVPVQSFSRILWNHLYVSITQIYHWETKSALLLFAMIINVNEKE